MFPFHPRRAGLALYTGKHNVAILKPRFVGHGRIRIQPRKHRAMDDERVECRTPAEGRDGVTRIPRWKYDAVRSAILGAVGAAGADGLPFRDLKAAAAERLSEGERARLGSLGWHVTTVKLNMEVEGELLRLPGVSPQRLVLANTKA